MSGEFWASSLECIPSLLTRLALRSGRVPREPAGAAPGGRHGRSGAAWAAHGPRSLPAIRALPSGQDQRPGGNHRGAPDVHHVGHPLHGAPPVSSPLTSVGRFPVVKLKGGCPFGGPTWSSKSSVAPCARPYGKSPARATWTSLSSKRSSATSSGP